MFPASMLSSLLVKGSLKNTPEGFEIRLRNNIDSGTITGMGPLDVDNRSIPPAQVLVKVGDRIIHGDQLSPRSPLPVRVMSEITITAEGETLAPGEHKITFQIMTAEAGRLQFTATEPLADAA